MFLSRIHVNVYHVLCALHYINNTIFDERVLLNQCLLLLVNKMTCNVKSSENMFCVYVLHCI